MIQAGDNLGPYTLMRALGSGAFGEVWLGERRSSLLTTQIALKLLFVVEDEIDPVRQEATLWLRASGHPNIVPVLDAEVYDGQVVIASEFIAGGTLHDWMQDRGDQARSLENAVAMTSGILAGLDYLHRVGLTHGDLKPENVLLQDGIPRLTDFGLARILKTEAQTENISGTPRYMAPETFSGSFSVGSDLWAAGVILFELLTGFHPFPTQEMMALIVAIQSEEPATLPDAVPERLRTIVTRLLAKVPRDRYISASAVREALQSSFQPLTAVPMAAADAPSLPPHNLPVQPTSFIGREQEMAELKALIEHTHLLTLTGSGGCGKTRLSLEVADDVLQDYADGVWLVEFAPLSDAALVPQAVATVLGVIEAPAEPITKTLIGALKDKNLLLVFDNCEHVLDAAARLADSVVHSCPKVKLLVSSRETLGIAGESAYSVPSLSLPDVTKVHTPDSLSKYEAVRLFSERAVAAKADFKVTDHTAAALASVCHRLDGIPLAIELAAARMRFMTVEELDRKLDDRFRILTGGSRTALPRQRTLQALIDWSFDLLDGSQKALLARLSVFMGGWTLEAAEVVCSGREVETWEILDLLTALVDKSLVITEQHDGTTRYRLLETVRQYAGEKLQESGEVDVVGVKHQRFYLALAEEAEPKLQGPEQAAWFDRLEIEQDNLRAAMEGGAKEAGLRTAGAMGWFWYVRGYWSEGRDRLIGSLRETGEGADAAARAKALNGAGLLAWAQRDYASARTLHEENLAAFRELGDKGGIANSLMCLGDVSRDQRDYTTARTLYEQSLGLFHELGDKGGIAYSLMSLGFVADYQEDYASARTVHGESLGLFRELGDKRGIATSLNILGDVAKAQGDYAAAWTLFEESLALHRELGAQPGVASSLYNLGQVASYQGDYGAARTLLEESLAIRRELGDKQGIAASLHNMGNVAKEQGDFASARTLYEQNLVIARELGGKLGIATSLEAFAALAAPQKQTEQAVRLWGAADRLREESVAPLPTNAREEYDRQVSAARTTLGDDALFDAVWQEGHAMTLDAAIEIALSG